MHGEGDRAGTSTSLVGESKEGAFGSSSEPKENVAGCRGKEERVPWKREQQEQSRAPDHLSHCSCCTELRCHRRWAAEVCRKHGLPPCGFKQGGEVRALFGVLAGEWASRGETESW